MEDVKTLRDEFAIAVLPFAMKRMYQVCDATDVDDNDLAGVDVFRASAFVAYHFADAMLAARTKEA